MARIPTFDAGSGDLHPSEAGSAAFREAGAITARNAARVGQMIEQEGRSISGGIAAFGKSLGEMQDKAQEHNDAMAEIDFQNQLAQSEIAAQGGVHEAGTPTTSDGQPITDHPGRGGDESLPADANVPSPGSYATAAAGAIDSHSNFLDNLLSNTLGMGVSQKARDRMALQAAASNRRLQVHAAAVAGEVAFTHATHTTEQTINGVYGAVSRGEMSIPDALDHIDGAYSAFQGSLSGTFAANGAKYVEKQQQGARQQAIWTGMYSKIQAGDMAGARAILNDPHYDKDIGGIRDQLEQKIQQTEQQHIRDQNARDKAAEAENSAKQDQLIDSIYRNSLLPPDQQDPSLTRGALELSPLFRGRPDDLNKARQTLDTLQKNTIDPNNSMQISRGISRGIMDGSITSPAQIDQAFQPDKPGQSITWQDRVRLQQELKDAKDNPAIKEFNGAVNDWLKRNEGQIDRTLGADVTGKSRSELGQQMVGRWSAEVQRRAQIMRSHDKDPHSLLDPNSPDSMVTPQALAPYRVTAQMEKQYQKNQSAIDKGVEGQRATGAVPTGQVEVPKPLQSIPGLARNPQTGQFYDPAAKQFYNADGSKAPMSLQPPKATPAPNTPITLPKGMTPADVKKNYAPGTRFIIPDGPKAGHVGVVPGKQSMNYAPENDNIAQSGAQQAINAALEPRPDPHLDKNLFSSGRYAELGIRGGVGENLAPITVQGQTIRVNAQAAPHFKAFLDELTARGYKIGSLGGYNDRMKRGSLSSYSEHAFGNAIDINPGSNPFHSHATDLPKDVSRIAAKYGLIWGGDWYGRTADPMHFEWSGKGGLTQFASR